ncbi:MAG TPA: ATP-binding protein [Methanosarcinales archaeon]|nr:ATP-binding protein [Methanosarcinales archaeon]
MTETEKKILDIIELLLTTNIYNKFKELNEDDLPPHIRKNYWNVPERVIKRPIHVTVENIKSIYGINDVKKYIKKIPFIDFQEFGSQLELTVFEVGAEWFARQNPHDILNRINKNPVLAFFYENYSDRATSLNNSSSPFIQGISYEIARANNKPKESDREWIEGLVKEVIADKEEMLGLVSITAPDDIRQKIKDLVLTKKQEKEIKKIIKAIEYRDYLEQIGLYEIGKLLFIGPPGTGKTSVARALSEHIGLPILEVKLSMVTDKYLGETSKNIDRVFELAKRLQPCILFIDEFDFIAKTRTSDEHASLKRAVNTLLKAIDNISLVDDGVLVIGATNHPKLLDSAAWRRFDEIVEFPLPDTEMRKKIMDIILSKIKGEFDTQIIAEKTNGYSGSDLRMVVREAVLDALVEERMVLNQEDILRAIKAFDIRIGLKNLSSE